jgi:hypothetical protein
LSGRNFVQRCCSTNARLGVGRDTTTNQSCQFCEGRSFI